MNSFMINHVYVPGLGSRSRSEPGVFGSLEPEPLEKKTGAGAAWKKSGAGAAKKFTSQLISYHLYTDFVKKNLYRATRKNREGNYLLLLQISILT